MGEVYLARDRRLGRQVALKFPHSATSTSDGTRRFLREARAASALNHPNICQVFDVGGEAESWIAMEYVEGQPLSTSITANGLAPDTVVRLAVEIARGLAHAHERGILHRDLKSRNIVCDTEGHPKILDFGIASRLPEAVAHDITRTGTGKFESGLEGSLSYLAPEALRGEALDERSDLWSLGVVLFELLTGTLPFTGRNAFELAAAVMDAPVPPLPARVPAPLAGVVGRLLSKDPAARYGKAQDVVRALESIDHRAPVNVRRLWLAAGVLVTIGLGVFVAWRAQRFAPLVVTGQRLVSTVEVLHRSPSFSPDGSTLVMVAPDAANVQQLSVQNLSAGTSIPITSGGVAASRPRWSPKGDRILYALQGQGIWSVSPIGGAPTRILERGTNPNFSRDGGRIVYEVGRQIWTADADGTNARALPGASPATYTLPQGPAFSPDGSRIAYFRAELGPNGDFWVIPSAGGTPGRLTSDMREGGWPVWTRDGRAIVFSSARAGSRTLWQIPAAGGEPIPLTTGAGDDDQPDLSPDGRQVAYTNVRNTWELRTRDLTRGVERTLVQRGTEVLFPHFSPDGRRLVFFGRADYAIAVFTIAADGTDLRQLTAGRELNHQPRWSGDGSEIYFFQASPEQSFRKISAMGGPSSSFRPWEWSTSHLPYFDPTGRFIVYLKQRPIGAPTTIPEHTIVHEIATGVERPWPEPHIHPGGWSPDGSEIVGWRHDGNIAICKPDGTCRALTKGTLPAWSSGDGRIYFLRSADFAATQELWSIATNGTTERREADLGSFRSIDVFFTVSRDGLVAWAPFRAGRHEIWTATVK